MLDCPVKREGEQGKAEEPGWLTVRDELIQDLLRIRTKTWRTRFQLNESQQEYSRRCTKRNIILKARQVGITTYIAGRFFIQTITRRGTLSVQVAHDREAAEEIFRIVKRFWNKLPSELREGALQTSHCNARQLVFPKLDSEYCVAAADENAGRGWTIQNLHCSEVARWGRGGEEALASLRAAVVPEGEIVLESTANGAGGLFYEEWQRADETGYTRHFFPWWFEKGYTKRPGKAFPALTAEEEELAARHRLSRGQIAWRRMQWAALRGLAPQEFAEDPVACFRASGECVFDQEAVERALKGSGEPVEMRDNHRLLIWLPPQPGREYVMGVDPAGGGAEGDYSCAQVIDRQLGTQCAELHGHYPPRELAQRVVELGKEYNQALIAVEKNNHGHGVLAYLRMLEYPNVFAQKGQDGWLTSAVSRPAMIENLASAVAEEAILFRSPRLLNECRTFVRYSDGNTGAAPGTHDDCVMALAIAWAVRMAEAGRARRVQLEWESLAGK
jgi:Terminase RNaseH-like domain